MITGKPYPIKGLIAYGTSLFHTLPNVPRTKQALQERSISTWRSTFCRKITSRGRMSCCPKRRTWNVTTSCGCAVTRRRTSRCASRQSSRTTQTKPAWWMVRELGITLGLEDFFKWKTAEEYLNQRLSSIGLNLDKLREQEWHHPPDPANRGWRISKRKTASPFATEERQGRAVRCVACRGETTSRCQNTKPTAEPPAGFFRLLYGRSPVHTFSRTTNTPVLNELMPENEVWVNDDAAAEARFEKRQIA